MNEKAELKETRYTHISGTDGLPLSVLRVEPVCPDKIKGIIQIVHGKNEHKERYHEFMRFAASKGFIVIANDHRGHGESVRVPEDRGYMYEGGYRAIVDDMHEITLEVKEYARGLCGGRKLPIAMLGHSMGSLAARCYIKKYDADIGKLCLTGSPSKSDKMMTGLVMIKSLELLEGKRAHSRFARFVIMWLPYEFKYRREGMHNSWTNTDRDAVISQNNDPLCRFTFTLSAFEEMIKMAMEAYSKDWSPKNPGLPIRFFSGAEDPCAKSRHRFAEAVRALKTAGYTDVRGKMYNGMRHDILREKQKHRVFDDIMRFIEA